MNQMFRDKLFLVMLVLGLLTMVAAAGVVTIRRGNGQEQKPYVDMQGQDEYFAEEAKDQAPRPRLPPIMPGSCFIIFFI